MIEPSRRHGFSDPRFSIQRAGAAPVRANGTTGVDELPAGLDWVAFSSLLFPGRRRHDLEVVKAYEAYKNGSSGPSDEPARDREAAFVLVGAG
jgi:hypothetical protein